MKAFSLISFVILAVIGFSCKKNRNSPGLEYAPEMYHSEAYEPLSQIKDKSTDEYNSNPNNPYEMTMRVPARNTIKMSGFTPLSMSYEKSSIVHIHKDSFELAGKILKNPLPKTESVLADGKVLYLRYCSHCHGENGEGDGLVGAVYKGVPSYKAGRVKMDTEGHIFHTITFGRNRMWPHASQISVNDRWKIVHYVQVLQNQ